MGWVRPSPTRGFPAPVAQAVRQRDRWHGTTAVLSRLQHPFTKGRGGSGEKLHRSAARPAHTYPRWHHAAVVRPDVRRGWRCRDGDAGKTGCRGVAGAHRRQAPRAGARPAVLVAILGLAGGHGHGQPRRELRLGQRRVRHVRVQASRHHLAHPELGHRDRPRGGAIGHRICGQAQQAHRLPHTHAQFRGQLATQLLRGTALDICLLDSAGLAPGAVVVHRIIGRGIAVSCRHCDAHRDVRHRHGIQVHAPDSRDGPRRARQALRRGGTCPWRARAHHPGQGRAEELHGHDSHAPRLVRWRPVGRHGHRRDYLPVGWRGQAGRRLDHDA